MLNGYARVPIPYPLPAMVALLTEIFRPSRPRPRAYCTRCRRIFAVRREMCSHCGKPVPKRLLASYREEFPWLGLP